MELKEALSGTQAPESVLSELMLVTLPYVSFAGESEEGFLIVNRALATDVRSIFEELAAMRFPIERMVPMHLYGWDDDRSMEDNNTSAFNYRLIAETDQVSNHSFGRAIDINPRVNPYYSRSNTVYPKGAMYDEGALGTITKDGPVVAVFKKYGWEWGGDWTDRKDYQHFQKL